MFGVTNVLISEHVQKNKMKCSKQQISKQMSWYVSQQRPAQV